MAVLNRRRISRRTVEALDVDRDTVFWDSDLQGFGVRVHPSGSKMYVAQTRGPLGSVRVSIGRHPIVGAGEARREALRIIAQLKDGRRPPLRASGNRNRGGPTVATLAERYLSEHVEAHCKPSTVAATRRSIRNHIVPKLGHLPLRALRSRHAIDLHSDLHATPVTANMAIGALSRIVRFARNLGLGPEGGNPCRAVARYKPRKRERFLTESEYDRLGKALKDAEVNGGVSAHAAAAIRLIVLTGCRCGEILSARWSDVSLERRALRLRDAKAGPRTVPLSNAAVAVLRTLPRDGGNPWVIRGRRRGKRMKDIRDPWRVVRSRAGLDDVRLHDLRHSFASRALAQGESLPMIARLLGHVRETATARYAHLDNGLVVDAAERVADSIAADALPNGLSGQGADDGGD